MEEMDWLPTEVAEIGDPLDVEADRLSTLAAKWRADADALQEPDGPSTADLREDNFLVTHFTDAHAWVAVEGEQLAHRPPTVLPVPTVSARNEEAVS